MDGRDNDISFSARRAITPLSVIVVGAGIGGLAVALCMRKTGHNVVVLEKKQAITEVGAGIQLAPNAARVLRRFGVLDEVMKHATVLEGISLRRWENDEELDFVPMTPDVEARFGAPVAVIHRADLQRVLLDAVIAAGCKVLTDHAVVDTDPQFAPRLLVRNNNSKNKYVWVHGDLVIGADGVSSTLRKRMATASGLSNRLQRLPNSNNPLTKTHQQLAYRFVLQRKHLVAANPDADLLLAALDKNHGMRYMGPGGHVMAYPLRNNTLYNVVLVRETKTKDESSSSSSRPKKKNMVSWTTRVSKEEAMEHYRDWCPFVQNLINCCCAPSSESEILMTPMSEMPPLPTWVMGRVALVGDACHYMFPYVAQGAANAIEDAAVLATAFTCTADIDRALDAYQRVRKVRAERIQNSAAATGRSLHLLDSAEQISRDKAIRNAGKSKGGEGGGGGENGGGGNPDKWNDRDFRDFMWGVDVMAETVGMFKRDLVQKTPKTKSKMQMQIQIQTPMQIQMQKRESVGCGWGEYRGMMETGTMKSDGGRI